MKCEPEELLELARGGLPPERASEVELHTESCADCARELAWLRTERALFRAQAPSAPPSHVWQGIERRIVIAHERQRERRQRWFQVGGGTAVLAAAASVLIYIWGPGMPAGHKAATEKPGSSSMLSPPRGAEEEPEVVAALDAAEHNYASAIHSLSAAYVRERDRLDPDEAERVDSELRKLKKVVLVERAAAKDDVWARRRVLRAYSAYMRTMQAVVLEVPK